MFLMCRCHWRTTKRYLAIVVHLIILIIWFSISTMWFLPRRDMSKTITLISGARKGIGAALVKHYIDRGHIVFGFSRSPLEHELDNYYYFEGDVTDKKYDMAKVNIIDRKSTR